MRAEIEAQIEQLYEQLAELDEGRRPEPNLVDLEDEARVIAYQMEQVITDIVRYGSMQNEITTGLIDAVEDSDAGFRDRSHRMFADYDALFNSRERASYAAFIRARARPRSTGQPARGYRHRHQRPTGYGCRTARLHGALLQIGVSADR